MSHVLLVDNYDSFTHNLAHAFRGAGATVDVVRNDAVDREEVAKRAPDALALSPGPGHPANPGDFGICRDLIAEPLPVPMLGICLGMQGMAHHTGGNVVPAPSIVHGEADTFTPGRHAIFDGLEGTIEVGRYHSLAVDRSSLPPDWEPLGSSSDGTLMAMAHRHQPWVGLQFHPESILTPEGPRMIRNFLELIP